MKAVEFLQKYNIKYCPIKVDYKQNGKEYKDNIKFNNIFTIDYIPELLNRQKKIDEYFERSKSAENNYLKAIHMGGSKTTYDRLIALYKVKLLQSEKAIKVIEEYQEKNKS